MKSVCKYLMPLAAAVLVTGGMVSCSEKQELPERVIDNVNIFLTKAGVNLEDYELAPDGSTYTVLLYNTLNGNSLFSFHTAGTYQYRDDGDPSTVDYLHACELTATGDYIEDNPKKGLNGISGSNPFDVAFVNPGIKANSDGSVTYYPNAGDAEGRLMAAGNIRRQIGEYNIIETDSLLYDRRCKIKYRVFLGRELRDESIKVNSITLRGAGECGPDTPVRYYPQTRQSKADTTLAKVVTSDMFTKNGIIHKDDELMPAGEGIDPEVVGLPYCELSEPFYIGSGIYAPLSQTAGVLGTIISDDMYLTGLDFLRIVVNVDQGSRTGIEQALVLNNRFYELSPQHEYVINIIVSSTYIRVVLDVYDADHNQWQATSGNLDNEQIGIYPYNLAIGTWQITDSTNEWQDLNISDAIGTPASTE